MQTSAMHSYMRHMPRYAAYAADECNALALRGVTARSQQY